MKIFYLMTLTFCFVTCTSKKDNTNNQSRIPNRVDTVVDDYVDRHVRDFFKDPKMVFQLKEKSLNQGDTLAYNKIFLNYVMDGRCDEVLYISLIMANKWKYPKAFFDTFGILSGECLGSSLENCTNNNRNLAIYFLLKSKELGYYQAKSTLESVFGQNVSIPTSRDYILRHSNL